jgi:hypothetical protein
LSREGSEKKAKDVLVESSLDGNGAWRREEGVKGWRRKDLKDKRERRKRERIGIQSWKGF